MFSKILIAIDGSDSAAHALEIGCDIAQKYGADVYLTHSPQIETAALALGAGMVVAAGDSALYTEAGKTLLAEAAKRATSLGAAPKDTLLGSDDPASDILRFADMQEADLIVMGRRGLGGIASLILGSVSQQVSHGAKCTCLTVHRNGG